MSFDLVLQTKFLNKINRENTKLFQGGFDTFIASLYKIQKQHFEKLFYTFEHIILCLNY